MEDNTEKYLKMSEEIEKFVNKNYNEDNCLKILFESTFLLIEHIMHKYPDIESRNVRDMVNGAFQAFMHDSRQNQRLEF